MKRHTMITTMFVLAVSGLGTTQAQDMMKGMDMHQASKESKAVRHEAVGTVTLAHGPVKSLNWPAMTMGFAVKDKTLFDKLSVGKKVNVEIVQQGGNYVITAVK